MDAVSSSAALDPLGNHSNQEWDSSTKNDHVIMSMETDLSDNSEESRHVHLSCWKSALFHVQSQWPILLSGQALSFLLACSGAAQATLSFDCHLTAPMLTIGLFYFGLSFCLIPVYLETKSKRRMKAAAQELSFQFEAATHDDGEEMKRDEVCVNTLDGSQEPRYSFFCGRIQLSTPAYVYFGMALVDVYANYFTVLAFKYTTITSVTLLDALAIPSALILSKCCLTRQYTSIHFVGVLCCMLGVVLNVMKDYEDDKSTMNDDIVAADFPHKIRGDLLAATAGILFGANNVLGEIAVRHLGGPNEYIGMLGFFASIICGIQTAILERDDIAEFIGRDPNHTNNQCSTNSARFLLLAFVLTNIISYIGGARFLQVSEATFLNLSLLTGDLWSVLFSVIAEKIVPHPLFFAALFITISGVVVYEMAPSPVQDEKNSQHSRVIKQSGRNLFGDISYD